MHRLRFFRRDQRGFRLNYPGTTSCDQRRVFLFAQLAPAVDSVAIFRKAGAHRALVLALPAASDHAGNAEPREYADDGNCREGR